MEMVAQAKMLVPDEPSSAAALRTYQASRRVQENPRAGTVRGESTAQPGVPNVAGTVPAAGSRGGKKKQQKGWRSS